MSGHVYGYIRVSTKEQCIDRQMQAMREAGVAEKDVYIDRQSGKDFSRPAYQRLRRRLSAGDTLIVKSIDRLGRNYAAVVEEWRYLTQEKGGAIVVLDLPILDTRRSCDLTGRLIADIVLALLSYVAQTEREFCRQRQREGIAAAKARGVRFGRPPKERPEAYEALREAWARGDVSAREAARRLGITHRTFLRWTRE
ncbi:recombinase family protein [uncultured Selenomonas sp.]|uniref:recombinase family protein n=1 Tax=uncultured Selenomonas sp. TaxID=159275 RepID=UPI0025E26E79|nr:recombinase family protein [uncultured Selenomonas sp.]